MWHSRGSLNIRSAHHIRTTFQSLGVVKHGLHIVWLFLYGHARALPLVSGGFSLRYLGSCVCSVNEHWQEDEDVCVSRHMVPLTRWFTAQRRRFWLRRVWWQETEVLCKVIDDDDFISVTYRREMRASRSSEDVSLTFKLRSRECLVSARHSALTLDYIYHPHTLSCVLEDSYTPWILICRPLCWFTRDFVTQQVERGMISSACRDFIWMFL